MDGSVYWPTRAPGDPPLLCAEQLWSHRGEGGGYVPGHLRPCTSPATWLARDDAAGTTTPLCGRHANTGRWAGYPDIVWRDLKLHPLEAGNGG